MKSDLSEEPILNPYVVLFIGVLGLSMSAIFTKLAAAPALTVAFYRMAISTLLTLPMAVAKTSRVNLHITKGQIGLALLAGALLAAHFTTWITSLAYTSVASSTVLVTTQPVFVTLGALILYKEKINLRSTLGGLLALAGSMLVGLSDFRVGGQALIGDMLALSGAVFVAGYVLIGRKLRQSIPLMFYTLLVYGSCTIVLALVGLIAETPFYPFSAQTWLLFLGLAVVPTICGHTLFNWALKYVKASAVSTFVLGEPVGATILAYFVFGEIPSMLQVMGGLLIITGLTYFIKTAHK